MLTGHSDKKDLSAYFIRDYGLQKNVFGGCDFVVDVLGFFEVSGIPFIHDLPYVLYVHISSNTIYIISHSPIPVRMLLFC